MEVFFTFSHKLSNALYASLSLGGSGHIISNMGTPQMMQDVGTSRTSSIITGQSDVQLVNSVHNSVHNSVQNSVQNSLHNSVQNSVANFGQHTSIHTQNSTLNSSVLNNSLNSSIMNKTADTFYSKTNKKKKKKKKTASAASQENNDQVLPQTPDAKNKRKFSASDAFDSAFSNEKNKDRSFTSSQATNLNKPKQVTKIVLPPKDNSSNSNTPKEGVKLEGVKLDGNKSEVTPTPSHAPSEISHKADQSMEVDPFAEPYLDESISGRKRIRSGDGVVEMPIKKKSKKEKKKINYVIDSDEEDLPIVIKKPKKMKKDKKEKSGLDKNIVDKKELKSKKVVEKQKSDRKRAKTIEIPDSPKKENSDLKLVIKLNTDPSKSETKSVLSSSPVKKRSMIDDKLEALKNSWNKPNTETLVASTIDSNNAETLNTNTPNAKPADTEKSPVTNSQETEKPTTVTS